MYLSTTVQLCYTIMLTDNTTTHHGVKSTCCDILESVISIILYKKKVICQNDMNSLKPVTSCPGTTPTTPSLSGVI